MHPKSSRPAALVALVFARSACGSAIRADRDIAAAQSSTDPVAECTPYNWAPVASFIKDYPVVWQTANLSKASAEDVAIFQSIEPGIANIPPRGTRTGNFTGVVYNSTDPYCWWSWDKCTHPKVAGLPDDITRCPEPMTYGLSFDDGPNCSHNAYYDFLQQTNQKATLNYIGSNIMDWPVQGQRGLADGHEICAHTWSHPYMTSMTNEEAFAELYYTKKIIKDVLGITTRCWRAPFGDVDDRIRYIAHQLDLKTYMWSADTNDFNWVTVGIPAVQKNYQAIIAGAAAGNYTTEGLIVLSHELNNETMVLGEQFLPTIQKTFTGGVMPIAVCQNNTNPYVEQNYQYPNYQQWAAGTRSVSLPSPTVLGDVTVQILGASATGTATGSSASGAGMTMTAKASASSGSSSSQQSTTAHSSATSIRAAMPVFASVALGFVVVLFA